MKPEAANMIKLKWDARLEHLAQKHAKKCLSTKSKPKTRTSKKYKTDIGENVHHTEGVTEHIFSYETDLNDVLYDLYYDSDNFESKNATFFTEEWSFGRAVEMAVKSWENEGRYYRYKDDECEKGSCDEYKMIVNAQTEVVGCAGIDLFKMAYIIFYC